MLVTFVVDSSASMNQVTSNGMTLLDYAKAAVERFVKRLRDPTRRYQHHLMLLSCGIDNVKANTQHSTTRQWNGRIRVGWDQSTNKDHFLQELKNLQATDVSDIGSAMKQAFELMNQIRLQFNWDNYGLGRTPWNTNVSICVLLTDGADFTNSQGVIQESLILPPSNAVAADLTHEPYRWDQRLYTIALKLSAFTQNEKAHPSCPPQLVALAEATGGMCYTPISKYGLEQSVDQIMLNLKSGAIIKLLPDIAENEFASAIRTIICPIPCGKEYLWPIPESFWLDRNSVTLTPREAHPTLIFRQTVETAIEAATNHMLLDTLKFPADSYTVEASMSVIPPRGQRWMLYVEGSRGDGRIGDPIGFLRAVFSGSSATILLTLLPYNYPQLFTLLVEAARVFQTSGQKFNATNGPWLFQTKAMPSTWRESFSAYINGCPVYYYPSLKKALCKYNLQDMVPDVQDSGRSYQISNFLNRAKEQSIIDNEKFNKICSSASRSGSIPSFSRVTGLDASSDLPKSQNENTHAGEHDTALDLVGKMSFDELLEIYGRTQKMLERRGPQKMTHMTDIIQSGDYNQFSSRVDRRQLVLTPSDQILENEIKHTQPIDIMSDYESRLVNREALRNPLSDPEPDEDTPAGLRRRQLCFNLGNPYKKNATKQQVNNIYQGEAADEAATLRGQSSKRQRTRRKSTGLSKKHTRRPSRIPESPNLSSPTISPSELPTSSGSSQLSTASSPTNVDRYGFMMSDSPQKSADSARSELTRLLGLRLGENHDDLCRDNLSQSIYQILVENWEAWSAIIRLLQARSNSHQDEQYILDALRSMKGGDAIVSSYVSRSINMAKQYKKNHMEQRFMELQSKNAMGKPSR